MLRRLSTAFKALKELGPRQVGLFGLYRLLLVSGWLRRATRRELQRAMQPGNQRSLALHPVMDLPDRQRLERLLGTAGRDRLMDEAEALLQGMVQLFGGPPVALNLQPAAPLLEWDAYERGARLSSSGNAGDIKFTWEPARFGWAFTLGRAYLLDGDERWAAGFWGYWEQFSDGNPPYRGPNWVSAQEAGLRILAFVFAGQVFAGSNHTTPGRLARLRESIAVHAGRIPATLLYARAQNNNHLLSEAAGLYTAGLALPDHPQARHWREIGWRWFHAGLQTQIESDGTYSQHSTSYQRLMLQLALWVRMLGQNERRPFPHKSQTRLEAATRWLMALLDAESGRVPNLGPQDGANILPLTTCAREDYRPVLQCAALAFLGIQPFETGAWDEMGEWLNARPRPDGSAPFSIRVANGENGVLHMPQRPSWAYLRAVRFHTRPGHADQLHVDVWWRGINIAQDAGSYLYNAAPPWDNALACSAVHNTLRVSGREQMTRAGRFLWLDRAQARKPVFEQAADGSWLRLTASHDGYKGLGIIHQRAVSASAGVWRVEDSVLPLSIRKLPAGTLDCQLQWLLPDWEWRLEQSEAAVSLDVRSPYGWIQLVVSSQAPAGQIAALQAALYRGGECLHGVGPASPTLGWVAPTYGTKIPALSLRVDAVGALPLLLTSEWRLP